MTILTKSTMFLNQISVVDHAYIDHTGAVIGGSFNPDFIVSGDVDPVEKVVVDFSTIKKDIKNIIDAKEDGFDHKLWLIVGYSQAEVQDNGDGYLYITTPKLEMSVPKDAVKIFTSYEYTNEAVGFAIGDWVEQKLRQQYPSINVTCYNNVQAHTTHYNDGNNQRSTPSYFTYVHGLKDSTSWGCQNIGHGHFSFLQLYPVTPQTLLLQQRIAAELDGTIFINKENLLDYPNPDEDRQYYEIEYTTGRGRFYAKYNSWTQKIRLLDTETTIEYLVDYIKTIYERDLEEVGVETILASEGLSKGAVATLD